MSNFNMKLNFNISILFIKSTRNLILQVSFDIYIIKTEVQIELTLFLTDLLYFFFSS